MKIEYESCKFSKLSKIASRNRLIRFLKRGRTSMAFAAALSFEDVLNLRVISHSGDITVVRKQRGNQIVIHGDVQKFEINHRNFELCIKQQKVQQATHYQTNNFNGYFSQTIVSTPSDSSRPKLTIELNDSILSQTVFELSGMTNCNVYALVANFIVLETSGSAQFTASLDNRKMFKLESSGAAITFVEFPKFVAENPTELSASLSGASQLSIHRYPVFHQNLILKTSGASKINLSSGANCNVQCEASGASFIRCQNLTQAAKQKSSSVSRIELINDPSFKIHFWKMPEDSVLQQFGILSDADDEKSEDDALPNPVTSLDNQAPIVPTRSPYPIWHDQRATKSYHCPQPNPNPNPSPNPNPNPSPQPNKQQFEESECSICFEECQDQYVPIPCGHLHVLCKVCLSNFQPHQRNCPICRGRVTNWQKIYHP